MKKFMIILAAFCGLTSFVASPAFAATTVSTEAELTAAVAAGGEITLGADITLDAYVEIPADVSVTIDLNGKTVAAGASGTYGCTFYNVNGGKVTIKDSGTTGELKGFVENNKSEMIIEGGTFTALDKYVIANAAGTMTINGGTFNCAENIAYAINSYKDGHKLTINNATVNAAFGCLNTYDAGEVVIEDGTFNFTGIEGKTSHIVYLSSDTTMTINGGTFTKTGDVDLSGEGGGGICAAGTSVLNISGGTFAGANADIYGYSSDTTIAITGGTYAHEVAENFVTTGSTITVAGKTYTKTESGLVEAFPAYVVLPEGTTVSNYETLFGENTVTDGEKYYATMTAALAGIHSTGKNTLYCKPGAYVGAMTHGHVCSSLIVYGNGATVSGGEQDFEVDTYKSNCDGITDELTLTVKNLNGAGAWGQRTTAHTLNLVFEGCEDMSRIFVSGTSGANNITVTNCTFTSNTGGDCKIYSNANGTITVTDCAFSNINEAINLNHKVAGEQIITVSDCTFDTVGDSTVNYAAPVRVLSSVEGATSTLTVSDCTFANTVANSNGQGADILLDYGVGTATASISGTAADVIVEQESDVNSVTQTTTTDKTYDVTNVDAVAKIGDTFYATFAEALAAAQADQTITLLADVTCTELPKFTKGGVVNVDINGNMFVSSEQDRVRPGDANYIKFVSGFGWEVYDDYSYASCEGDTFRVFPTLDEAIAYEPAKLNPARIYPYENVVQDKDVTLRAYSHGTSSTICVDPTYDITWDLNGYTVLQENPTGNPLETYIRGKFTLADSSDAKTGKWIAAACGVTDSSNSWYGSGGPAFIVYGDGDLVLNGGTISIARNDNGDVVNTGGLLRIDGGTMQINDGVTLEVEDFYGIMNWGGDVTVNGGTFNVDTTNHTATIYNYGYYGAASATVNSYFPGMLYTLGTNYGYGATATVNVSNILYYSDGTTTTIVAPTVGSGLQASGFVTTLSGAAAVILDDLTATSYATIADAIDAAQNGDEIIFLADVHVTCKDDRVRIATALDVTLNLNGYTISSAYKHAVVVTTGNKDANITIKNGTIEAMTPTETQKDTYGLLVYNGADVTLENLTIKNATDGVLICSDESNENGGKDTNNTTSLIVKSGVTITASNIAITANGSYPNTAITINEGAIVTGGNLGIYHPQWGSLTINGGTITGATGVYMKSGSLAMSGGTIVGNGAKADYTPDTSGTTPTGDALVIENVGGDTFYYEITDVSITGGTFTSENGKAVAAYACTAMNPEAVAVSGFISGGTFSSAVPEDYCVDGYIPADLGGGQYGVAVDPAYGKVAKIGDTYYETLKEAFAAAAAAKGATIDLLDSEYDGSLTIDTATDVVLNEGTYTLTGGKGVLLPAELFLQSTDATKPVKLVIAEGAHVTIPKLTLRDNAELEITKARLDSAVFEGGSAYLSVYNNAKLTATEAVIGYNPTKTGSADPVDTVVGMYNNWGYRISVYGTATFDNSKVYAYVGQADNCGFDVLGSGSVTATDSTIYTALFKVGEAYSSKYLNSAADTSDLTATLALTGTTAENIMYRGDSTNNNGLRIGNSADATVKGVVTITDSTVDFTKIVYGDSREVGLKVQDANSSVTIANSTVKFPNGANVGTINVTDSTVELAKFDNDYLMFIFGENTVKIADATGSSYAVRVNDGAVLNNSYIKSTDNMTTRFLGSATLNGGYECAYLQGAGSSQGGVGGTLTIEDGTTVKVSYGVDFGHNYVINGGTIELSGGNASGSIWGCVFQNGEFTINADIVVNGGTVTAPIHFTSATATVNGSITQTAPGGEVIYITGSDVTFASTSTVTSDTGVHVTNSSLASAGNVNANIKANEGATIAISGGTYTQAIPADWCEDGFTPVKNADGTYGVGVLPNAIVSNLGAITVGEGDYADVTSYYVYDLIGGSGLSSATEPFKLSIAMDFTAKDTAEEAAANAFGDYTTDFFITMNGMTQESFSGNGCYLAGYYPSYGGWVKIPLDGFTIVKDTTYPVITSAGFDFSYVDICKSVGQFICGIYLTPEVLAANPDMTVDLTLGLSEDFDAAQMPEFTKVDNYVYTVDNFLGNVAQIGETKYKTLEDAITAAVAGDTVTLLGDIVLAETVTVAEGKAIILDLNGKTINAALNGDSTTNHIYAFTNNGTLTITDSSTEKNGAINSRGNYNYGTLFLEAGTINAIDGNGGYAVWNQEGSAFTMNGGTVAATYEDDNLVDEGGYDATAVRVEAGATFTMNGGTINNVSDYTFAIDNSGTTTVEGGTITSVHTTVRNNGTMTIDGGTFTCNGVDGQTQHVVWGEAGTTTINGGTFDGKDTYNGFNVVASAGATVNITGGNFLSVHSGSLHGDGTIAVSGGTFFDEVPENRCANGYEPVANADGTYGVAVTLPEVEITDIKNTLTGDNPDLTFALNFAIKDIENLTNDYLEALMAKYGDYYTDYVLTISGLTDESVTFNANGDADGYLSGQYDAWSENWVSVPFENVTIQNEQSLYIMEYAAELMNKTGLRFTLREVAEIVQNFNCGVYFTPEFLAANPGIKVELELKVFTEDENGNKINDISVATNEFDVEDIVAIVEGEDKQSVYCTSLADAIAAAESGDTVQLLKDVALAETVTVAADDNITLELNGKTVSMQDASGTGAYLLKNYGDLTIKDSSDPSTGKLTFVSTTPSTSNSYSTSTIGNGGKLTIEGGTIENTTASGPRYAIDTIWYSSDVSLTINGGTVTSTGNAIRQVLYSTTANNVLNVTGGTIIGGYAAIQTHNFQTTACLADVNISGGTIVGNGGYAYYTSYANNVGHGGTDVDISGGTFTGAVYVYNSKTGASETDFANVAISGGTFNDVVRVYTKDADGNTVQIGAISGGTHYVAIEEGFCADGYIPADNGNGTYGVKEGAYVARNTTTGVGYETLDAAIDAANADNLVTILDPEVANGETTVIATTGGTDAEPIEGKDAAEIAKVLGGAFKVVTEGEGEELVKTLVYDYDLGVQAVTFTANKFVMTIGLTEGDAKVTRPFTDRWVVVSVGETKVASCALTEIDEGTATVELSQETTQDKILGAAPESGSTTKRISFKITDEDPDKITDEDSESEESTL